MAENQEIAMSQSLDRFQLACNRGGIYYAILYIVRKLLERVMNRLDGRLVGVEQRSNIVEPWSISASRFTVSENKNLWDSYDWSKRGEEWTPDAEWKQQIVLNFLVPNVPEGSTVLEIGPGGGRWTEVLRARTSNLIVLDISDRALSLCRERFASFANIDYLLGNGCSIDLPDGSIDTIWSYDVFVHINPVDARSYFREFVRVLRPGGRAVIHHPGPMNTRELNPRGWRSDLTESLVDGFIVENNFKLISRTPAYVNPGDVLSIIAKR